MISVRDVPASVGWVLCAKRLNICKDMRIYILRYLFKEIKCFDPIRGIIWNEMQIRMYKSLYLPQRQVLFKGNRRSGIAYGLCGITASFSAKGLSVTIFVASQQSRINMGSILVSMTCTNVRLINVLEANDVVNNYSQCDLTIIENNAKLICTAQKEWVPPFDTSSFYTVQCEQ